MAEGICAFLDWTPEQRAQADREHEEEKRQHDEEVKREAEVAAWEADQQKLRDSIDAACFPWLKDELEAVNKVSRVSDKDKELFKKFQATCERWGFQALPACPQAVAVHLVQIDGAAAMARAARSITRIHMATQMGIDPCDDCLIKGVLLQARNEEKSSQKASLQPTKGNDNGCI